VVLQHRVLPLYQQLQSDQELSTLSVLAMRRRLRLGDLEDDEGPPVAAAPQPTTIINTVQEPFDYSRLNKVETTVSFC
jgi:hypothetical protein